MKQDNLELFYDCIDESICVLYEALKDKYFVLLEYTINNILEGKVLQDISNEHINKLNKIYSKIEGVDFSVEEVRKALQGIFLKAFKEMNLLATITPDTIGYIFAYFISRLDNLKSKISILDPFVGTGNLIFSIYNHLDRQIDLFGIDNNIDNIKLAMLSSRLQDTHIELYMQDVMNKKMNNNMDFLVFDCPTVSYSKDENYFLYDFLLFQKESVKDSGYMLGLIPNDFFDYDVNQNFKKELLKDTSIVAIIELPEGFFLGKAKSIIVLKKSVLKIKKCLMLKLPTLENVKEFNKTLSEIENWLNKNLNL
ncbi:MAG: class I SAM-dependent methyltransferase [Anaeroplasmataceae bacterium]